MREICTSGSDGGPGLSPGLPDNPRLQRRISGKTGRARVPCPRRTVVYAYGHGSLCCPVFLGASPFRFVSS